MDLIEVGRTVIQNILEGIIAQNNNSMPAKLFKVYFRQRVQHKFS